MTEQDRLKAKILNLEERLLKTTAIFELMNYGLDKGLPIRPNSEEHNAIKLVLHALKAEQ